jgi:hypothetical protein
VIVYASGPAVRSAFPDVLGPGSGPLFFLTLIYVLWLPATVVGLIWALDRLGVHYAARRKERPPSRRASRRLRAGLRYLEAQERTRKEASGGRADRRARGGATTGADGRDEPQPPTGGDG